jgi:hypothetical protein
MAKNENEKQKIRFLEREPLFVRRIWPVPNNVLLGPRALTFNERFEAYIQSALSCSNRTER